MIQVKEVVNTTNKEEFISKKYLRQIFCRSVLSCVCASLNSPEEVDDYDNIRTFRSNVFGIRFMAHNSGIISDAESACIQIFLDRIFDNVSFEGSVPAFVLVCQTKKDFLYYLKTTFA